MSREVYQYQFSKKVSVEKVETTLVLAITAVESLHGQSQTRLDARHFLDGGKQACVIDASTPVGRDLNRLFVGFLSQDFEPADFHVNRMTDATGQERKPCQA